MYRIFLSLFMILCTESYFIIDLYKCDIVPNLIELVINIMHREFFQDRSVQVSYCTKSE